MSASNPWTTRAPYDAAAVAITGGTSLWDSGAQATPSIAFAADSGTGFWLNGAGSLRASVTGAQAFRADASGNFVIGAGLFLGGGSTLATVDTTIVRDAGNTVAQKNGNSAQEFRVYAGNGGFISQVKSVTESLTIAAAATTVSATTIPAGAILLAVSVRVTTIIPTAATFTVTTTTGGTTLNTAAVSSAANSTDAGTAAGASYRAASTTVTITPNLTPGAATGVVRLQYYYLQVTPATS